MFVRGRVWSCRRDCPYVPRGLGINATLIQVLHARVAPLLHTGFGRKDVRENYIRAGSFVAGVDGGQRVCRRPVDDIKGLAAGDREPAGAICQSLRQAIPQTLLPRFHRAGCD